MASGNPDERYQPEPMRPEYLERDAATATARRSRAWRAACSSPAHSRWPPSTTSTTPTRSTPTSRSYNRWYDEAWGFNYQDRIYATALLSLRDLDHAVALDRRRSSPAAPRWCCCRPVRRTAAARATRTSTRSGRGSTRPASSWRCTSCRSGTSTPSRRHGATTPTRSAWHMSAWQWMNIYGERPVVDTISALIFDNLFGRYPEPEGARRRARRRAGCRTPSRTWTRAAAWAATVRGSAASSTERPSRDLQAARAGRAVSRGRHPGHRRRARRRRRRASCSAPTSLIAEGVVTPADFEALLDPLGDDAKRRIMHENAEAIFDARD